MVRFKIIKYKVFTIPNLIPADQKKTRLLGRVFFSSHTYYEVYILFKKETSVFYTVDIFITEIKDIISYNNAIY
jgi:hypothetical protein